MRKAVISALASALVATAAIAAPAAGPEPDPAGARALIDRIYTPYTHDEVPDLDGVYTPELNRAIARQSDGDLGLGYDPFCSCQDTGQFSYRIVALDARGEGATARIERSNFGETSSVTLALARRAGRWLIADIVDENGSLLNPD